MENNIRTSSFTMDFSRALLYSKYTGMSSTCYLLCSTTLQTVPCLSTCNPQV